MSDAILPGRIAMAVSRWSSMGSRRLVEVWLTSGLAIASFAGLVAATIVLTSLHAAHAPVLGSVDAVPSAPMWVDIVKPVQIYSLEARELAKLPSTYAARRRGGDIREDVLGFGTWHGDQPSLRLRVLRGGEAPAALDTAIVRQAAAVGVAIGPSKKPEMLATRFGAFEIADVTSSGPGATMACSGLRLAVALPALTFDGFACGAEGQAIPRKTLACLIDRLDLASVGEDRALIDFFAATDLRRDADCDGMRLAPDRAHAAWLDDKSAPVAPTVGRSASRRHRRHRH